MMFRLRIWFCSTQLALSSAEISLTWRCIALNEATEDIGSAIIHFDTNDLPGCFHLTKSGERKFVEN